ncbi:MAG: C40 family peptidase [Actinomycetota bacterium]
MPISRRTTYRHVRGPAAGLVAILVLALLAQARPASALLDHGGRHHRTREERVAAVLKAARSARGVPYRYGGTSPRGGFDCSGFTRWAWAHGGRNLPHNSGAQFGAVRWHVKRRRLQPGDLLFFYSPISHVGLYLGHGRMIDAEHTGTRIHIHTVFWQYFTAAARPA